MSSLSGGGGGVIYFSTACHWLASRGGGSPSQFFFGIQDMLYLCMDSVLVFLTEKIKNRNYWNVEPSMTKQLG